MSDQSAVTSFEDPETNNPSLPQNVLLKRLRADLDARGMFSANWFWTRKLAFWVPMLVASFFFAWTTHSLGLRVLASVVAAFAMLQMGYVGHDAGHMALSPRRWVNDFWGNVGMSLICGMSFGFWRQRHNAHHARCQEQERDPDMQFGVLFSVYPNSPSWHSPLGRFFLRIQAWSFWPLTSLYWVTLRYDALRDLFQQPETTKIDRFLLPLHFILLLGLPIYFFGAIPVITTYVIASCVSSVMTAAVFVPNHIGMRSLTPAEHITWLEQQVETSRDIANPPALDFLFGGLNAQIEHHLFPKVSHGNLRAMRAPVRNFCRENNISYHEEGIFSALGSVRRHLAAMTAAYQATRGVDAKTPVPDVGND